MYNNTIQSLSSADFSATEYHILELLNQTDVDVLNCLNNTNSSAKEEFLADKSLLAPNNRYDNLDIEPIECHLSICEEIKSALFTSQIPEARRIIYEAILDFNFKKNQFVLATHMYNTSTSESEKLLSGARHQNANIALYGSIDESIFFSILNQKIKSIHVHSLSLSEKKVFGELLELVGSIPQIDVKSSSPSDDVFRAFSELVNRFYAPFFSHIPTNQQTFTAFDVCRITNEIICKELKPQSEGWKAIVDINRATAATDTRNKEILYPGKRSRGLYTYEDTKTIIAHELGVHALRSMPFSECPLSALATGFPGYEEFEEGIATAVEQALLGKFEQRGLLHYVSIGLATFLKKNFRETFEIQTRLEYLTSGTTPSQCFDSVQRAFRGTGVLPNNKDLVYFNGNRLIWGFIDGLIEDPNQLLMHLFQTGKSNPMDKIYPAILQILGNGTVL